ncbi:MAG: hypothetical protein GXO22_04355 [Aquificae bacterium]|nr:hypothetical protein [Aquificota bacterium]
MAYSLERQLEKVPFVPDGNRSIPMPRNNAYSMLFLTLSVTYNTSASVNLKPWHFYNLIERLTITANSNLVVKDLPFKALPIKTLFYTGKLPYVNYSTTPSSTGLKATVTAPLFFKLPRMIRPHDALLFAPNLTSLDLSVNWANETAIGTGVTVTDAELKIATEEFVDWDIEKNPVSLFKETFRIEDVTGSQTGRLIRLNPETTYRAINLVTFDDNGLRNDIITRTKISIGAVVFKDVEAETLRHKNNNIFGLQDDVDGLYRLDFAPRGYLTDTLKAKNVPNVELYIDQQANGTNPKILILPEEVV